MIRVLIIDDEPNGVKSAKAGLIPFRKRNENLDVDYLCDLAEDNFNIEFEDEVSAAIKSLKSFLPDFVIIDINIKEKKPFEAKGMTIRNGIDIYRFIDKFYPDVIKIMFSNYGNDSSYIIGLSEEESQNFINKAVGSGYQILASKINKYLKFVAQNILLKLTPNERTNLLNLVNNQDWEVLADFKIRVIAREFTLKHFVLFCSYPELINKKPVIKFTNPKEELVKLLKAYNPNANKNKNRSEWGSESINDLFNYFVLDIENSTKRVYNVAEQIIKAIIDNMSKSPNLRLTAHIDYRLAEHISQEHNHTNSHFNDKFYNALSIRLVLRFFEMFIRENIDTGLSRPQSKFKKFFNEMPNMVLQSVKQRGVAFSKQEMTQEGRNLNLGFKLLDDTRELVEIDIYIEYDYETKWLHSIKYQELSQMLLHQL